MRLQSVRALAPSVLALSLFTADASAHHRPGHQEGPDPAPGAITRPTARPTSGGETTAREPWLRVTITEEERAVLLRYREELVVLGKPGKKNRLPPGLAKKVARGEGLPPGWQKKVGRGEIMEQDLYLLSSRVPPRIVQELPRQPRGTVWVVLEGKLVRLVQATREILDVLDLI